MCKFELFIKIIKSWRQFEIGQKFTLSEQKIFEINKNYNCEQNHKPFIYL